MFVFSKVINACFVVSITHINFSMMDTYKNGELAILYIVDALIQGVF